VIEVPNASRLSVDPDVVEHPLLGDAHLILHAGEPITAMSAIDWQRPTQIPTIAEPRALPRGTGTLLINEIALRAQRAGVQTLRYAGPYPTPALFTSLSRSFRASAPEAVFTNDVLGRAMRLARDEVPVDFTPAPFERRKMPYGSIDVRDGIERAVIDDVLFDREGVVGSVARLDLDGDSAANPLQVSGTHAVLAFGEAVWKTIATLAPDGTLVGEVRPIPPFTGNLIGKSFPLELKEQFAALVADAVPAPLAQDARSVILARPIVWADLGWRAAAIQDDGFALHAGWWVYLAPRGVQAFALAVSDALATVITQVILDEVTR
jgi:hypothetical protein